MSLLVCACGFQPLALAIPVVVQRLTFLAQCRLARGEIAARRIISLLRLIDRLFGLIELGARGAGLGLRAAGLGRGASVASAGLRLGVAGKAARWSSTVPRVLRMTSPGCAKGSSISAASVTCSATPRANRSVSVPQACNAAFWLGAAT
ncbi:hypothetical protein BJP26_09320 [Sphingomonas melonis TY]|nr:hypothetical protein BJP26_09320 [Sphingomonas melonis TY]